MASEKYQLTRRKFMIAGSAAVAMPLLTILPGVGGIPEAAACFPESSRESVLQNPSQNT